MKEKKKSGTHESTVVSYSSATSLDARNEIFGYFDSFPGTTEEKERSLGLFVRGSLLARFTAIGELYKKIVNLPGAILDLGTWRGQTAVLCENYRAIYEPLHLNRRIICFDTFEGYKGFSAKDKPTSLHQDGTYAVGGAKYAEYLRELLELHEKSNAMGHNFGKHKVIVGDCRQTLPRYFKENPNEFVALAFFDVNSVEPTRKAFDLVYERLVPGGIVAFWQLTRNTIPAEGMVYADHILPDAKFKHAIEKVSVYPGLCYLTRPL